jgi:hypothetical protein
MRQPAKLVPRCLFLSIESSSHSLVFYNDCNTFFCFCKGFFLRFITTKAFFSHTDKLIFCLTLQSKLSYLFHTFNCVNLAQLVKFSLSFPLHNLLEDFILLVFESTKMNFQEQRKWEQRKKGIDC